MLKSHCGLDDRMCEFATVLNRDVLAGSSTTGSNVLISVVFLPVKFVLFQPGLHLG